MALQKYNGLIIFLFTLLLHLWTVGADLPNLYNADEPHQMNIAAHFGTGDLNPHDFKYPTLWPYTIAVIYGFLFLFHWFFGLVKNTQEFSYLFLNSPTIFYLSVRIFSAILISFAAWIITHIGSKFYNRKTGTIVGWLVALSVIYVEFGRDATIYNLMLFMMALSFYLLHELTKTSSPRAFFINGLVIGLSISTHYLAAPIALLLLSAYYYGPKSKRKLKNLAIGITGIPMGFLMGTPFALLDHKTFFEFIMNLKNQQAGILVDDAFSRINQTLIVLKNHATFLDGWGIGGVLLLVGISTLIFKRKRKVLLWLSPLLFTIPWLSNSFYGYSHRYAMAAFFPIMLITAMGFTWLWDQTSKSKLLRYALLAFVFIPPFAHATHIAVIQMLPDTRTQAKKWITQNIPLNQKVLVSDPYYCPQLKMNKVQLERLHQRAKDNQHPREIYFSLLLDGYTGGMYEVYFLKRNYFEAEDIPDRVDRAYQSMDTIDPEEGGLKLIRQNGIQYVVLEEGIIKKRPDSYWIKQLWNQNHLIAKFEPVKGQSKGVGVYIFKISG